MVTDVVVNNFNSEIEYHDTTKTVAWLYNNDFFWLYKKAKSGLKLESHVVQTINTKLKAIRNERNKESVQSS